MKKLLLSSLCLTMAATTMQAQSPTADFTAQEAKNVYFDDDFDDQTLPQWDITQVCASGTWRTLAATADFKAIVPSSTRRLYVQSYKNVAMNEDITTKDAINVLPGTRVSFYAMVNLADVMSANLFVSEGENRTVVLDFAPWIAAHSDYAEKQWDLYTVDLSDFAGKSVHLGFNYSGTSTGTSNYVSLEDIDVYQYQLEGIPATVELGRSIHFVNNSKGADLTYQWTFDGGIPATSTEAEPVVTYTTPGNFDVSLTVSDGTNTDTKTISGFAHAVYGKPVAAARYPQQGYTIYTNCQPIVAPGLPVTFRDASSGYPTAWKWEFLDSKKNVIATDSVQQPTVTFAEAGQYSYTLTVRNPAGENTMSAATMQVGSAAATNGRHIWNVANDEKPANVTPQLIDEAYPAKGYIGSNDEGITRWAEYFHYAGQPLSIEGVTLIFSSIAATANTSNITMSIHEVGTDGMPGRELYSAKPTLVQSSGVWSTTNTKKTWINMSQDQTFINGPFYIVVSGIPAYEGGANNIQIAAIPHEQQADNTAYIFRNNKWQPATKPLSLPFIPYVNFHETKIAAAAERSLEANFSAQEAQAPYFTDDFEQGLNQWTIDTVCTTTWRTLAAKATYKVIDPASKLQLYCAGKKDMASNETILMAQPVEVKEGSEVSAYISMNLAGLYNSSLIAVEGTDTLTLIDFAQWQQQQPGFSTTEWYRVGSDLSTLAGHNVRLGFTFNGMGSSSASMNVEDFRLYQTGADTIMATVRTGQQVHFRNLSTQGATYAWEFEGGEPATSNSASPVVTYNSVGTYDVKLTVTYGDTQVAKHIDNFVQVVPQVPVARVEFLNGYHRAVSGNILVAPYKPFTIRDASTNNPTWWKWTVMDANKNVVATSTDDHITLQFDTLLTAYKSAFYQFTMTAGNATGETTYTSASQEIKVGASDAIWNINKEESGEWQHYLNAMPDGKGYYAGCNDMGITAWAERFDAPMDTAAITQVGILFCNVNNYARGTKITMTLNEVADDGTPGQVIEGSEIQKNPSELSTSQRKSTTYTTKFKYDDNYPVLITRPFFVVVSGFGPYEGGQTNDIRMMSMLREAPAFNSVWTLQNGQWKESDTPMSMFVSPWLSYSKVTVDQAVTTGIVTTPVATNAQPAYYDLNGHQLQQAPKNGLYIMRQADGSMVKRLAK